MIARFLTSVVTFLVLDSFTATAVPRCAGPVALANARFVAIDKKTGALDFAGGTTVHLEGIRLPAGALDRAPMRYAESAFNEIEEVARSGPVKLSVIPPRLDRYRRLRAQAFVGEHWLQADLLERGLARVSLAPDRTECASDLRAVEAEARLKKKGLWAWPGYAIRSSQSVRRDVGTFQIVEGSVVNATLKGGRAYLNFGSNWRTDFTVTVDPEDMAYFRRAGVDPRAYEGQTIQVRGWVQWHYGPEIEVPNPQSIEVIK